MSRILFIGGMVAMYLGVFGLIGHYDAEAESVQRSHYCAMVAQWEADGRRGLEEQDRAGWPPYKGECK